MKLLTLMVSAVMGLGVQALAQETTLPTEYTVEMWNKDPEDKKRKMVFSKDIIQVAPGAVITWLATDKGHNVQFIDGPDGVELAKKSKVSRDVTLTLDEPGVYVYVCTPHASTGMLALVIVGDATADAIEQAADAKVRGKSKEKLKTLLAGL